MAHWTTEVYLEPDQNPNYPEGGWKRVAEGEKEHCFKMMIIGKQSNPSKQYRVEETKPDLTIT